MTAYLCAYHINGIRSDENKAIQSWSQLMHRGLKAYVECRVEAAEIYFQAALDVAKVRLELRRNRIFSDMQWRKPVEFLLQLYGAQGELQSLQALGAEVAALPGYCDTGAVRGAFSNAQEAVLARDGLWPNSKNAPVGALH